MVVSYCIVKLMEKVLKKVRRMGKDHFIYNQCNLNGMEGSKNEWGNNTSCVAAKCKRKPHSAGHETVKQVVCANVFPPSHKTDTKRHLKI